MNKSKLNEFCQRSGWGLPMYSCIKDGEDHNPHFKGSVFVNGLTFVAETIAKSTKVAQNEAAQLALSHFLNDVVATAGNPKTATKKVPSINSCNSDVNKDSTLKVNLYLLLGNGASSQTLDDLFRSLRFCGISSKTADLGSPTPTGKKAKEISTPASESPASVDSQVTVTTYDLSALSISECKPKTAIESHLLGNRVRVYTSFPDVDLPKGTVVLPISDDKWTVVRLDFPNEIAT